uniref:Uncharacterized protein n=1 Tax=Manihot esculenta TaxID=3983 RepID=A0A2C9W277_MANES
MVIGLFIELSAPLSTLRIEVWLSYFTHSKEPKRIINILMPKLINGTNLGVGVATVLSFTTII